MDETRTAACKSPVFAWLYAQWIDWKPSAETKEAANKSFIWGEQYKNLERECDAEHRKN
jgi:hypothetical protein